MFDQNQPNQNLAKPSVNPIQPQSFDSPKSVNNPVATNPWLNQINFSQSKNSTQPEDIFANTSEIPTVHNLYQKPPVNQYYSPSAINYANYSNEGINFNKMMIFLFGLLMVIFLLVVIYFVYKYLTFSKPTLMTEINELPSTTTNNDNSVIINQSINNNNNNKETTTNSNSNQNQSANINSISSSINIEQDSDSDGLTDTEEELQFKTNPYSADTDNDGLTDWAEIKLYKTDPLNFDTDDDGYKDGEEVVKGYDPNRGGNARLFEVSQ